MNDHACLHLHECATDPKGAVLATSTAGSGHLAERLFLGLGLLIASSTGVTVVVTLVVQCWR